MAKVGLQCSGIDPLVGQRVAAGVPEHVRMDLEPDLGFVAGAGEQLGKAGRGERATPLLNSMACRSYSDGMIATFSRGVGAPLIWTIRGSALSSNCRTLRMPSQP